MKFVTLASDFTTVDLTAPLFTVAIAKGVRFGIRSGNMFESGDYLTKDETTFVRYNYFGYGKDLRIPVEFLTEKSLDNLRNK